MDKRLSLENRIGVELKSYDGLMGIYINDFRGNVIRIHDREKFETASTIKLFVLAALFDRIHKGELSLQDMLEYKKEHVIDGSGILSSMEVGTKLSLKNIATLMIIVSDNIATNMLIDFLGVEAINDCIGRLGCRDTVLHNRIDFEAYSRLEQMLAICRQQHYNSMLTKNLPPYYLDPDNYEEEIIYVASKSGSMDACRNDGGIVSTPYGSYVIVMFNKDFGDNQYYAEHPATVFGSRVSRLIFDQYLALEGRLVL